MPMDNVSAMTGVQNPFPAIHKRERIANVLGTGVGLAGVALMAKGTDMLVKKNPNLTNKAAGKVGDAINYLSGKTPLKLKNIAKNLVMKFEGYKLGDKVIKALKDFKAGDALARGKFALKGAGIGAVAFLTFNVIKNHFYNKGRIDQKLNDSNAIRNLM